MEMTGRVTANAKVTETKDGRKVTNFSIAINDRYKNKEGELKELTTFVNCSYWIASKVADVLRKGAIVEVSGRISATAFMGRDGEPKASLNCHVNSIKIHHFGKREEEEAGNAVPAVSAAATDDLPF